MRVLLLATTTGYQVRSFGDAAARVGVEIVFATDRCHVLDDPWADRAISIRFYDEDGSTEAVLEAISKDPVAGVLAVGDPPTVIAARVARALGLPWHAPEGAAASRNKLLTRERLRASGEPTPWFRSVSIEASPAALATEFAFPCVVKPLSLSASRGVVRVNSASEFLVAFERLRRLLSAPEIQALRKPDHRTILIEEYIPGEELAVEALLDRGRLMPLAIFDKPDPLEGPFFEETIYVTPSRLSDELQHSVLSAVARASAAMGLSHGPLHAECRLHEGGVYALEIAARPIGGLCAASLRFASGQNVPVADISLEELLIRHAIGESVADYRREADASGVMMIPVPGEGVFRRVEGVEDALGVTGVEDIRITAKPDQRLVPWPEGASYPGFIFARAGTAGEVERALREAHQRLRFVVDPVLTVARA